jgi:serine phosphatase RsbU (regulator of sigma subunit)/tetratricopeptide (TPR) repeat protein
MKKGILIIILVFINGYLNSFGFSQESSKRSNIQHSEENRDVKRLINKGNFFKNNNVDSSLYFYNLASSKISSKKESSIELKLMQIEIARLKALVFQEISETKKRDDEMMFANQILAEIKKNIDKKDPNKSSKAQISIRLTEALFLLKEGNFEKSLAQNEQIIKEAKKLNLSDEIAEAKGNIGAIHVNLGNFKLALENLFEALKINEKANNQERMCANYGNIGVVYDYQGESKKAINYYKKALNLSQILNLKSYQVNYLGNLGVVYMFMDSLETALNYFTTSLKINEEIKNLDGQAADLSNIGTLFSIQGDHIQAKNYFLKAYEIVKLTNNKYNEAIFLSNIGTEYYNLKDYANSEKYILESNELAHKINALEIVKSNYFALYELFEKKGDFKKALENHQKYIELKDKIYNEEATKAGIEKELEFEYEKKATADSISFAKEKIIQHEKLMAKKKQQYFLVTILLIAVFFSYFIYKRYKLTQKQKEIIKLQKDNVELINEELNTKNREILESITYAKRIQSAILPQPKLVKEYLSDSFILYKPKDIVAGDFYWFENVEDTILFAAADCTGHGVPGAMVSVVCHNGLNRSVREHKLVNPAKILDKTRELVVAEFEKSEEDVKDGMDISLCALNLKQLSLEWAGANNPLWIIRNGELIEFKSDKQAIGKVDSPKPFTNHYVELQQNDTIYLFTDGFQDQFGGPKEKKFRAAQLKEILFSIQELNLEEQKKSLDTCFENWKGSLEQVDDVCLIGVRV